MASFGPTFVVEPREDKIHDYTAIMLHDHGCTGKQFAERLFSTKLSDGASSLLDRLPSWRWVFPTAKLFLNAVSREESPSWFALDDTRPPKIPVIGARASVKHIRGIVQEESERVRQSTGARDGNPRIVLGGIGMGGAIALYTLLGTHETHRPLGGIVAHGTWLLFAGVVEMFLGQARGFTEAAADDGVANGVAVPQGCLAGNRGWLPYGYTIERVRAQARGLTEPIEAPCWQQAPVLEGPETCARPLSVHLSFVSNSMRYLRNNLAAAAHKGQKETLPVLKTPIFLVHGRDDARIPVAYGMQAVRVLARVGFTAVEWRDYTGATEEGHWFKSPDEVEDIAHFLFSVAGFRFTLLEEE